MNRVQRAACRVLGLSSLIAQSRDHANLIDGLRRDQQATTDVLRQAAKQLNQSTSIIMGLLAKHRAWEAADKNLRLASQRLSEQQKRFARQAQSKTNGTPVVAATADTDVPDASPPPALAS